MAARKDLTLEALRGLAAFVVVLDHCAAAFWPARMGLLAGDRSQIWQASPLFLFVNGRAAVALFFVLSGFVLARAYMLSGAAMLLVRGAVKRLPRLAGPVLIAVLLSCALFKFDLYAFPQAGQASGSPWLERFAFAYDKPFVPSWRDALAQGLYRTFFFGESNYDSSLWTMHIEFIGSFIIFAAAPVLRRVTALSLPLGWMTVAALSVAAYCHNPYLAGFGFGLGLAAFLPAAAAAPRPWFWPALLVSLYLLGFSGECLGAYAPLAVLPPILVGTTILQSLGAAMLIVLAEADPRLRRAFSDKVARILGDLSFPVYLLNVPVICSLGAWVYLQAGRYVAAVVILAGVTACAAPLVWFNRIWIGMLNRGLDGVWRRSE